MMTYHTFEKASKNYNDYARIQAISAQMICDACPSKTPLRIIDIGCGTGLLTTKISKKYPASLIVALDSSPGMIRQLSVLNYKNVSKLCMDFMSHQPQQPYNLLVSNAALHWMPVVKALQWGHHVMAPSGQCVFTIYGPGTSSELSELVPIVKKSGDLTPRQFLKQSQLISAGRRIFYKWSVVTHHITLRFDSVGALFNTQRYTGVVAPGRWAGLWTPRQLINLEHAFLDRYGQVQCTYEIHCCVGERGALRA
jgi:SAM-dependent methyltransferase